MLVLPAAPRMETGSARGTKTPVPTPAMDHLVCLDYKIQDNNKFKREDLLRPSMSHKRKQSKEERRGEFMFLKTSNVQEMILCLLKPVKCVLISAALQIRTLGIKPLK